MTLPPCAALQDDAVISRLLYASVKTAGFRGAGGGHFRFTSSGDGPGAMRVLNYRIGGEEGFQEVRPST